MSLEENAVATKDNYEEEVKDKGSLVRLWLDAIEVASKEEETWRGLGQQAVDLYRQATGSNNMFYDAKKKFNILHSNIETLVPALYNSRPIPDVRRRFNDPDPIGKQVADIQERCIEYSIDSYDFDHTMQMVVKDMELPGRAVARVRYKPYLGENDNIDYQEVTCEHTPWKQFRRGPGNEWDDVPWIAFELFLTREELIKVSPKFGATIDLDVSVNPANRTVRNDDRNVPEVFKRARVWEIWDKERRKVIFIATSYREAPIREEDDPLGLENFFPIPRPLYGIQTGDSLVPVVPYEIYRAQAEELERISQRIVILTEAVKAKAVYDGRLSKEMEMLERGEDADNVPVENIAIFSDGSKLSDHISWYPIETIVAALKECFEAREQIKATIYEITGISDILRGQSQASETATAQNIKQQWGSLRIQSKQAEIQRFARDLFRLKAELFATKFEPNTLQVMTGIQVTPQVMQLMRSDKMRGYRVDVESDSTIRADLSRNQQNMTQFLQGTAQFAQAMGPIVMTFQQLTPAVMEVFSAFARNFRLGKQAEDALDSVADQAKQMASQPKPPNPEQQAQAAKIQMDAQNAQQELALKAKQHQDQMAFQVQQHNDKLVQSAQQHQNEMALKSQELNQQAQQHQNEMAVAHQKNMNDMNVAYDQMAMQGDGEFRGPQNLGFFGKMKQQNSDIMDLLTSIAGEAAQLKQAVTTLAAEVNAPAQIVRDRTGKAVGVKKGSRTMKVQRGPDGKAVALQ